MLPGFGYGSRYPALLLQVQVRVLTQAQCAALAAALQPLTGMAGTTVAGHDMAAACDWLLQTVQQLQQAAGVAVEDRARVRELKAPRARLILPAGLLSLPALLPCVQALLGVLSAQASEQPLDAPVGQLSMAFLALKKTRTPGSNSQRFVRAAMALGMPVQDLPGGLVQYGHGQRARWLDSSFTDETSLFSTRLARDKTQTASLLRMSGLPVPPHQRAGNLDDALRIAGRLGYPVVVKPANMDGGVGVAAGLLNAAQVTAAFHASRQHSSDTLVEKHVDGRDYRLVVFQDELVLAIERVPAGVTGDGVHTVAQLLAQLNADPRRGNGAHALLQQVPMDDEAQGLLHSQGLTVSAVPAAGQFVRLRSAANIASGGMPVSVLAQVHPDNRLLAVRAAKALRLDLAGVDLLIPDIAQSWRVSGAGICEVNSQPSLGEITSAPVYAQILRALVRGNGRIPTVVVLGAAGSTCVADIEAALLARGVCVGCHDADGVRVNGVQFLAAGATPYAAGRLLVLERSVAVLVLSVTDASVLQTGLPFDRFDFLLTTPTPFDKQSAVLAMILPACTGPVLPVADWQVDELQAVANKKA